MAAAAASDWQPVNLRPEFSAEVHALLVSDNLAAVVKRVRRRDEEFHTKFKKHLLALHWLISSRPNPGVLAPPRLRYVSPLDGKSYYSLLRLIKIINIRRLHAAPPHPDDDATQSQSQSPSPSQSESSEDTDTTVDIETLDDDDDDHHQEQDGHHQEEEDAIAEYVAFMKEDGSRKSKEQRSKGKLLVNKAKEQLVSSGWMLWKTTKYNGRLELRYKDPQNGRSYISLITACKAYLLRRPPLPPTTTTTTCSSSKEKTPKKRTPPADSSNSNCKKRKKKARVLQPRETNEHGHARTVLSLLIDKKIVKPREKINYRAKKGLITGDGMVKCVCGGCSKMRRREELTVAEFAAHGGVSSEDERRPWALMFLKDGRSLSQCMLQLMAMGLGENSSIKSRRKKKTYERGAWVKRKWWDADEDDDDDVCSICHECGELVICDCCQSMFHHGCVGLDSTPPGDWFCPPCRCGVCGNSDFDDPVNSTGSSSGSLRGFSDKIVIYCNQCQREYHAGCVRENEVWCPKSEGEGPWLCSESCSNIYLHLEGLIAAASTSTAAVSMSLVVLRHGAAQDRGDGEETQAEEYAKLCLALDVLHECFVPLTEPRTHTDLTADIVFNSSQVYGDKVAELPLVGTRFAHRRQGMCRLLMNKLEKLLGKIGVKRLVLPAVPELVATWTGSFGFREMGQSDRQELAHHPIVCFQGTTMCHKFLNPDAN
uniref:PHD-type domain-containing protein n=1 Tax=Leersia perrieri TaxID=77586 RepID=A0A0D9X396_9ORYZ